jgi:hypothetical protein
MWVIQLNVRIPGGEVEVFLIVQPEQADAGLQQRDLLYITNFRCILRLEIATYARLKSRETCPRNGTFRADLTQIANFFNVNYCCLSTLNDL